MLTAQFEWGTRLRNLAYILPPRYRPASITALTILQIIVGIIDITFGLLIFLAFQNPGSFAGSFVGITFLFLLPPFGVAWLTFGLLAFILAAAIWKGKRWSWLLSLILATDALVLGCFGALIGSLAVALPLALYGLVIIFLCLGRVREYFGSTYNPAPFGFPQAPPAWVAPPYPTAPPIYAPAVTQPYSPRPPPPAQHLAGWGALGACPSCGVPLQADATFCFGCGRRFR